MRSQIKSTTILTVRRDGIVAMAGDGQVTLEHRVIKHNASKLRRMYHGKVLSGFAGSTADALTLFQKFDAKLEEYRGNLTRAAVELARDWRTDRVLRRLEALMLVADLEHTFLVSGTGDLLEPEAGIMAIGSGAAYAQAAATALLQFTELGAEAVALESMKIAAAMCIYTNDQILVETLVVPTGESAAER